MTALAEDWFPGDPPPPGAVIDPWWEDEGGEAVDEVEGSSEEAA